MRVGQGTCDAAFNWWNDEQESNLLRMGRKGIVKPDDYPDRLQVRADRELADDVSFVTLPDDLKAAIKKAILDVAAKDPAAFDKIYEGKQKPFQSIDHKAYEPMVELIKFVDELRKKKTS